MDDLQSRIKRRKNKVTLVALSGVVLWIVLSIIGMRSPNENGPAIVDSEMTVYVCTGNYASAYHKSKSCRGLGNCKASVKALMRTSAIKGGRKACRICW